MKTNKNENESKYVTSFSCESLHSVKYICLRLLHLVEGLSSRSYKMLGTCAESLSCSSLIFEQSSTFCSL